MIIPIHEANEGQRANALTQMKLSLTENNTVPMSYMGGTLGISIGPECSVIVNLTNEDLTREEQMAAARVYIKNKTESHCFYKKAQEILDLTDHPTQEEEIVMLRNALERLKHNFEVYMERKPVRNLDEVFAEVENALEKTAKYGD